MLKTYQITLVLSTQKPVVLAIHDANLLWVANDTRLIVISLDYCYSSHKGMQQQQNYHPLRTVVEQKTSIYRIMPQLLLYSSMMCVSVALNLGQEQMAKTFFHFEISRNHLFRVFSQDNTKQRFRLKNRRSWKKATTRLVQ